MRAIAFAAFSIGFFFSTASFALPEALLGKWRIVAVSGAYVFDRTKARAEFAANGRYASTIGCNRIAGKPTISGAKMSFGPMMTTRMACLSPFDTLEGHYLDALTAVRSYRIDGGKLSFLNEAGDEVVGLERLD